MKNFFQAYLSKWWVPAVCCLFPLSLLLFSLALMIRSLFTVALSLILYLVFPLLIVFFLGVLVAAVWNLGKKRFKVAFSNLGLFLLLFSCVCFLFLACCSLMMHALFSDSVDHFADNLTLPEGVELSSPLPQISPFERTGYDPFQLALRQALRDPGSMTIIPSIPSLRKSSTSHPALLQRYLETAPEWQAFFDGKAFVAERSWRRGKKSLYETDATLADSEYVHPFQTRCRLSFSSKGRAGCVEEGTKPFQIDKKGVNQNQHRSLLRIDCGGIQVEILDVSDQAERKITQKTIDLLETEFAQFLKDPEQAIRNAGVRSSQACLNQGEAGQAFSLMNGMQPGIYQLCCTVNPGGPGILYLKAFEITQGTPLSVNPIKERTSMRIGWSESKSDRFFGIEEFVLYEGDWGKPYGARFELWFIPDSGEAEQKLAERLYKVEGWER